MGLPVTFGTDHTSSMITAIVGHAAAGRTTVFNALTRSEAPTGSYGASRGLNIGLGAKPDSRLDYLESAFSARKKVRAEMEFWDMPTDYAKSDVFTRESVNSMQRVNCMLIVVRAFEDPSVPHPAGNISWTRDLGNLLFDVTFADIELIHRRIERITDGMKALKSSDRDAAKRNIEVLQQIESRLESGEPLRESESSDAEARALSGAFTLSSLPIVVAVNIGEGDIGVATSDNLESQARDALGEQAIGPATRIAPICGTVEQELRQMPDDESAAMRTELYAGIDASEELMSECLSALSLDTFYTASDKEVRAWHFPAELPASEAAGIIHSDMERGFIRAEVVAFDAFSQCGSMVAAKRAGSLRQEGRDYTFKDGDIAHFLFSV